MKINYKDTIYVITPVHNYRNLAIKICSLDEQIDIVDLTEIDIFKLSSFKEAYQVSDWVESLVKDYLYTIETTKDSEYRHYEERLSRNIVTMFEI